MSRKHLVRLGAFLLAAVLIFLAMLTGGGGGGRTGPRGPAGRPGAVATRQPEDAAASRQGEFRRRNPFQIVRTHPPPPPPTTPSARPAPAALPPPTQAPEKPLPLRLVGTIAGDPLGQAFLRSLDRNVEFPMSVGDNLVDHIGEAYRGVILTEVRRKRVVFSRGRKSWTLELGEDPIGAGPPARVAVPKPVAPAASGPPPPAGEAGGSRTVNRAEVEQNLKNLGYLITQLNVQPFFQNGQPSGFRVSRIRPGSFVDKMGARNGDIIQGVNGKPIRTIKDAFLLYNSFKTQNSVQVQVLRNGKPTTMGFQLR